MKDGEWMCRDLSQWQHKHVVLSNNYFFACYSYIIKSRKYLHAEVLQHVTNTCGVLLTEW